MTEQGLKPQHAGLLIDLQHRTQSSPSTIDTKLLGHIMVAIRFIVVCASTVTCLHAIMFKNVFVFSYCLFCSTSFHPLSETRAQSALIG